MTKAMSKNTGKIINLYGEIGNMSMLQVLQNEHVYNAHTDDTQVLRVL